MCKTDEVGVVTLVSPMCLDAKTAIIHFSSLSSDSEEVSAQTAIRNASLYYYVPREDREDQMQMHHDRCEEAAQYYTETGQVPSWMLDALEYFIKDLVLQANKD